MSVWSGLEVALMGGDGREAEMALIALNHGAVVRTYGVPDTGVASPVRRCSSLEEACDGVKVGILPVPLMASDGTVYAPHAKAPILIENKHLALMADDAHLVAGRVDEGLRNAALAAGVTIHEYESDTDLMLLRAPAVAEGAIRVAIERSPVTIHDTDVAVVGFGRIASVLTASLIALNARVHVIARRAEARAAAHAIGARAHRFEDIPSLFPKIMILFNTAPAPVIGGDELTHLPLNALAIDLSAPPGGIDLSAAREMGIDGFWARGLGASAPLTVARSQWIGVDRIISNALAE
ncbi:MAG: serine carboxypeptidase [Actinomycetota bacterium]|nr:serine carboxypeptidase [Actinomycetota bacterium]